MNELNNWYAVQNVIATESDGWDEICITRGNRKDLLRRSEGNRPVQRVSVRLEDNIKKGFWQDAMMLAEVYWLMLAFTV